MLNPDLINQGVAANSINNQIIYLKERSIGLYRAFRESLENNDYGRCKDIYESLVDSRRVRQDLEDISNHCFAVKPEVPTFLISPLIVSQAFRKLGEIQTESIIYASGFEYNDHLTIEHLSFLDMKESTIGFAKASTKSITNALSELEHYGNLLTCYFHMHPGKGKHANTPSEIDYSNQSAYESAGYRAIGGIFSRDGHLRFFSKNQEFKIQIIGKGIENVAPNQYFLTAK